MEILEIDPCSGLVVGVNGYESQLFYTKKYLRRAEIVLHLIGLVLLS